jgi:putative inorganic carbon (HCO3(-)) transporter
MNFVLFLLLNAALMLRPEEYFPDIAGVRIYLMTFVLCIAANLPKLLEVLSLESLRNRPIAVCVLTYYASTIISLCLVGRVSEGILELGPNFAKVILYYFLMIAVVDTRSRFQTYVATLVVLISILTTLSLAQHFGLVEFPNISANMQRETDPLTGERTIVIPRLVSSGIFNDPNDLCLVLGLGILSCIYCSTTSPSPVGKLCWLSPIPVLVYALMETHSRGGLLGIMAGLSAYLFSRYGGAKSLAIAAVGAVVVIVAVGGRQTEMGAETAHSRIMLWSDGLKELFNSPLYIPTGLGDGWYVESCGLVAHNTFVQAYVEQGLLGGGALLGAYYLTGRMLLLLGRGIDAPSWVIQARHYAFGVLVGYFMGCYSLTRNLVVPTYLILGIGSILLGTFDPVLPEKFRVNANWFKWAILFSICGLLFIKFATQTLSTLGF